MWSGDLDSAGLTLGNRSLARKEDWRGQERGAWPSGVIQCVQEKEFIQWVKQTGVHLPL